MAKIPEGAVAVDPKDVEALEKQQSQSSQFQFKMPEGAIPIEGIPTGGNSRADRLSREMEHQSFVPGISDSQIETLKDKAPAAIGGMIGAPFGQAALGTRTGAFLGAFTGGVMGENAKNIYNFYYDPEKFPPTPDKRIESLVLAGGEEVFAELGGRLVASVAGKMYHVARPKLRGGMKGLNEAFSKFGGKFTQAQQTESFLVEQLDSITRGSMSGRGAMQAADLANDAALIRWRDNLSNLIAKDAKKHMSASEFGDLMLNTLTGGKAAFKKYISELYGGLDDLVKTETRLTLEAKGVPSSIVDERGKALVRDQLDTLVEELRPVDVRPLKESAADLIVRLQEAGNLGLSDFGGSTINKILQLDDALKFSTAQNVRSTLLELGRAAKESGEDKLAGSIAKFSGKISKAMDAAAKRQSPETLLRYQAIKREAESGYSAFNDKFIFRFLNEKSNIEKLSADLFAEGNSRKIFKFRRALNEAAKHDETINADQIMGQVKQNYLEDILNRSSKVQKMEPGMKVGEFRETSGVPAAENLARFFGEDPRISTMNALFSPREQQALFDLGTALQRTQEANQAGMSIIGPIVQAGVTVQLVSNPGAETAKRAVGFLLPTRLMAHLMTDPKWVKLLTSAAETPIWAKQAPVISTKLMILLNNIEREEQGRDSLGEDVGNFLKGAVSNNFNAALSSLGLDEVAETGMNKIMDTLERDQED